MDNPNPEPNKDLENAASALNEAAVAAEATEPVVEPSAEPVAAAATEPATPAAPAAPIVEAPAAPAAPIVEAPAAPAAPVAPAEAKKGNKKNLIIGCAVGAVVLVGGGVGVAYAISHSPENVALSAISNFFGTKDLSVRGTFELTPTENAKSKDFSRIAMTINNDSDNDHQTDTSVTLTVTYKDKDYSLTFGGVVIKDYTAYISISNLKETVNQVMNEAIKGSGYEDYADLYKDLIDSVVGEIDGVWWKISVPDILDTVEELSASQKATYKEVYQCVVDVADKAAKENNMAAIYKDNAFVSLTKYEGDKKFSGKGTAYNLSISAAKLTNFINKTSEKANGYGMDECLKKIDSSYTSEKSEVKQEEIEKYVKELPENMVVTIESGFFDSKLTGFFLDIDEKQYNGKVELLFEKSKKQISAPSDSKPITDLYKNVMKAYEDWEATSRCKVLKQQYPSYYDVYCDPATNKIRPEYESYFQS